MLPKDYLIDKKEKSECVSNPTHLLTPTSHAQAVNAQRPKIVRNTLKILHQMLQDFESMSDHFGRLFIKRLKSKTYRLINPLSAYPTKW